MLDALILEIISSANRPLGFDFLGARNLQRFSIQGSRDQRCLDIWQVERLKVLVSTSGRGYSLANLLQNQFDSPRFPYLDCI